jgi:hypothetical protein
MSTIIDNLQIETSLVAPSATTSVDGLMSAFDKTKIDGIASGATANSSDAFLLDRTNHTGFQTSVTISDFTSSVLTSITGGASSVVSSNLTLNRALSSDAAGKIAVATTTLTELNFVNGVTSSIQTQLNNKQGLDSTLTALAAFNSNGIVTQTAADTFTSRTITGTVSNIVVTNGDGVSGNPTINLATAGTAGTYGSATQVPVFTTDSFGRVTSVTNTAITFPAAPVTSVFGRTGSIVAASNDYTWAQIDKSISSLADLTTRSATDLSSGTLADARLSSNVALKNINNNFSAVQSINVAGASSILNLSMSAGFSFPAKLVFTGSVANTLSSITTDGGDFYINSGNNRALSFSSFHGLILRGGRGVTTDPSSDVGNGSTYNTKIVNTANSVGLAIQGNTSQGANLIEVTNSASSVLFSVDPTGKVVGDTPVNSNHLTTKNYVDTKSISGDVTGTLAASTVAKIHNITVASTTPLNGQSLAYNSATSQWEPQSVGGGSGVSSITTSASTLTLTSSSNTYQLFTGTVHGQSVVLPDATTLTSGSDYFLANKSDTLIPVYFNGGILACILYPDQYLECLVLDTSTAAGKWVIETAVPNAMSQIQLYDDFISSGTTSGAIGNMGWTLVTGTTAVQASTGTSRGIIRINSTAANNGTVAIHLGTNNILTSGGVLVYEARVAIPVLGGTGAAGFTARFGLGDTTGNADQANGIYFEYTGTVAGTVNWAFKTATANTRTTTTSAVAITATTFYKLSWVLNAAGTSVGFYINNSYIASIATNIPTAAIGNLVHITTNGTNVAAKACDVDYVYITNNFNTVR